MTPEIGITSCGKLGDFYFELPIGSWLYKTTGRKIHWILARNFPLLHKVTRLLWLQEMTGSVTFLDIPGWPLGWGGQPRSSFNPKAHGIQVDDYYNMGFDGWPTCFVTQHFANNTTGGNWDKDWVLNLGDFPRTEAILRTEHGSITRADRQDAVLCRAVEPDWNRDCLAVLQQFAGARTRCCGASSVAVAMMFANLPYRFYLEPGQGRDHIETFQGFRPELRTVVEPVRAGGGA